MKLRDLRLNLDQLLLDPNNYRLDYDSDGKTYSGYEIIDQQEITQRRLDKEKLGELRDSIVENGFLEMDRIVVRVLDEKAQNKQYVVVEGNRRTAAFKGLLEDYSDGIINLPKSLIEKANSIGVICVEGSDKEIEEFSSSLMGIRHVSGPKKWTGYQSARLINDRFKAGVSLTKIGLLLGITSKDAGRRLRGYHAYIQMKNDKVFGSKTKTKHYTLLLEFLTPSGMARDWLGWDDAEFLFKNKKHINRVYSAVTSVDGLRPEVNNTAEARYFIKLLNYDKQRREMLERGDQITAIPPPNENTSSKEVPFKNFIYLLSNLDADDLNPDEISYLEEIQIKLRELLEEGKVS